MRTFTDHRLTYRFISYNSLPEGICDVVFDAVSVLLCPTLAALNPRRKQEGLFYIEKQASGYTGTSSWQCCGSGPVRSGTFWPGRTRSRINRSGSEHKKPCCSPTLCKLNIRHYSRSLVFPW